VLLVLEGNHDFNMSFGFYSKNNDGIEKIFNLLGIFDVKENVMKTTLAIL
jgi:hypothetical protein